MQLIGWTSAWLSPYSQAPLTEEKRMALVGCIRKRKYNFTYQSHQSLPYAAPLFKDNTYCLLTKPQWDAVMDEAYGDNPRGARKLPMDVITSPPKNDVLFEKKKFDTEGDANDG